MEKLTKTQKFKENREKNNPIEAHHKHFFLFVILTTVAILCVNFINPATFTCNSNNLMTTATGTIGCVINVTDDYDYVFTIDNSNYTEKSLGELISMFHKMDFNRGFMSRTSNISGIPEDELNETIDDYLVDSCDTDNSQCINLSYAFSDASRKEYFSVHYQLTELDSGIDIVNLTDGVSIILDIGTADELELKFRIFGRNLSNSSQTLYCDSLYYDLRNTTDFIEYFIPLSQIDGDCELNFSNIHQISTQFREENIATSDTGSVLIKRVELRKSPTYIIDDWNYYNLDDNDAVSRWVVSTLSSGASYSNPVSNITIVYEGSASMSMRYSLQGQGGAGDYINVRRSTPYTMNISEFDSIGAYFRVHGNNNTKIKFRLEDSGGDDCDSDYVNVLNDSAWHFLNFNISDLSSDCDEEAVKRFGFQLNDISNGVDITDATVNIDKYYLRKNSIFVNLTADWFNTSLTSNRTINWTITLTNSTGSVTSALQQFNVTNNWTYNTSAILLTESLNLINYVNHTINVSEAGDNIYQRASETDLENFRGAIRQIELENYTQASINASLFDYEVVNVTHNLTGESYILLRPQNEINKGWGYVLYNPNFNTPLVMGSPHPREDGHTGLMAINGFLTTDARWLFISSAHRNDRINYEAEPIERFNVFHPLTEGFEEVIDDNIIYFEFHGFSESNHPNYPDVIISNGIGSTGTIYTNLENNLWTESGGLIDGEVYSGGSTYADLKNKYSQWGAYSRSNAQTFISVEIDSGIRNSASLRQDFYDALYDTLYMPITENSQTYNSTTHEGATESFVINITFDSSEFVNINAILNYNGTDYVPTKSQNGDEVIFRRSLSVPQVSGNSNITFQWEVSYGSNYTFYSTKYNQTVKILNIDDCSSYSVEILNFSLKDEELQNELNASLYNTSVMVHVQLYPTGSSSEILNYSQNFSENNNPRICVEDLNSTYDMDVQVFYDGDGYSAEFYHIQDNSLSNSSIPNNINLFDLEDADATKFLITYKNDYFLPVENALIQIQRKYIDEGVFKNVEIPKTDANGQARASFDVDKAVYTIIVTKNGEVLSTFDNIAVICQDSIIGDCDINLNSANTGIDDDDWEIVNNTAFSFSFDKDTRTVSVIFATTDGTTKTYRLNVTKFDRWGNTSVCSDSLTTSSGTLSCIVPDSFGNITIVADFYWGMDSVLLGREIFSIRPDVADVFGRNGSAMLIILMLVFPLIFITSTIGVIIGMIIGLIFGSMLMLYEGVTIFETGSFILYLIVAGALIIWRVVKDLS